jgi:hypothetical protein
LKYSGCRRMSPEFHWACDAPGPEFFARRGVELSARKALYIRGFGLTV